MYIYFSTEEKIEYLQKLKGKIYKLLPIREEGGDWKNYLDGLLVELAGINRTFYQLNSTYFTSLIGRLVGLDNTSFPLFRKMIFESINSVELLIAESGETNGLRKL
jgi:hypothetical protein